MALLKSAWRLLIGIKDALALLFLLLFFAVCFMLLSTSPTVGDLRGGALYINLDGVLVEQATPADPLALVGGGAPVVGQTQTRDIVHGLRTAAKDANIKTVVLDMNGFFGGGMVSLQDVAGAIDEVRKAGKPVLAYATAYSDDSYLLAAHASEVWLDPLGGVLIAGPGGSQPYFKGLLDRFGVNVNVFKVGKFKSAVEPFIETQQSPDAKAANQALADALWADWQAHVKKARPKARFAEQLADPAAAAGDKTLADSALALGLVDKVADETAFAKRVAQLAGSDDSKGPSDFNRSDLSAYVTANPDDDGSDSVAIIAVAGEIIDGEAPGGTAGGDTIARQIAQVAEDTSIKALVLRVDSPGGSVTASEKIRLAIADVKAAKKPVVISMANVAASGGYWIAMGADRVFAEPATITGSIGVFGIIPTFERTLGNYGVTTDGVRTTPLSGQPDILGGLTPETDRLIQAGINDVYARFIGLVSGARKLPRERVDEIAQGRVWDGGTARQLGLIDAFGSLDDALADAAKRASIDADDVRRVWIEDQPGWLEALAGSYAVKAAPMGADPVSHMTARRQMELISAFSDAQRIARGSAVQVRCLECPVMAVRPLSSSFFDRFFK